MASKLGIINAALGFLGEPPLTNLSEGNKLVKVAEIYYDISRDAALKALPWNFAIKRAELTQDVTAPVFEFQFRYQLPADCLTVLYTDDDIWSRETGQRWPYKVEGRFLVTDLSAVKIKYIARVTEEGNFDASFVVAFACYLAYMMAMSMTEHRNQANDLYALFKDKVSEARHLESQEGTPDPPIDGGWLASRA